MSKMMGNGSIGMKSRYIVLMFFWGGGVALERDLQQYIYVE
jgi:hypothetical protein